MKKYESPKMMIVDVGGSETIANHADEESGWGPLVPLIADRYI